jgi:hypothetical protein
LFDLSVLINLPIGAVSMIILFFALRHIDLERPNVPTLPDFLRTFDAIGLLLFLSSTVLLVFGFSFASQYGCKKVLLAFSMDFF